MWCDVGGEVVCRGVMDGCGVMWWCGVAWGNGGMWCDVRGEVVWCTRVLLQACQKLWCGLTPFLWCFEDV